MFTAMVITVSDRCFRGEREDAAGPAVGKLLADSGYSVEKTALVPDEREAIRNALEAGVEQGFALIITTGGTGFSPRDVTPEATLEVCTRLAPGIPEAMRAASMAITPRGMLSRGVAGIAGMSLIINLPGSPGAAKENLQAVLPALDHGLQMLRGGAADCAAVKSE